MEESIITASLVVYHNSKEDVQKVIESILGHGSVSVLFIVDNSNEDSLSELCDNQRIRYIFNNANLGFGPAHNIAFEEAYKLKSNYHIILNPDLHFEPSIITDMIYRAISDPTIGLIMPKIVYPDGLTQHLCKLLPSPTDLILRRFLPVKKINEFLRNRYELRFFSYNEEATIPSLSGCFMVVRTSVLRSVEGFDERFFMYLEDVDLCRRIGKTNKLIYFPKVKVVHNYAKGSYTNNKLLLYHIRSAIKYFNKWGWIFDKERNRINKQTLLKLNTKHIIDNRYSEKSSHVISSISVSDI